MGLSQSFPSESGGKARPQTGFHFTVQKRPAPGSGGPFLAKRPNLESGNEAYPSGKPIEKEEVESPVPSCGRGI